MNDERHAHWQGVYQTRAEQQTSWYRPHLDASLRWIDRLALPSETPVIDVGGGRSTLVDDLLERGFTDVTVLDLSEGALAQSRERLGARADGVTWIAGDVTGVTLSAGRFGLWHDRAVFHFLTDDAARQRYVDAAAGAIAGGGYLIIATFASDGPERCSGLPVARYDADALAACFAAHFDRVADDRDVHRTPFDTEQPFTYLILRRHGEAAGAPTP